MLLQTQTGEETKEKARRHRKYSGAAGLSIGASGITLYLPGLLPV